MGVEDQSQPQAIFKVIHHLHMMGTEADLISGETDIILHIAGPHGEGDTIVIQRFFYGTYGTFTVLIKNIIYWNGIKLFFHNDLFSVIFNLWLIITYFMKKSKKVRKQEKNKDIII